MVRANGTTLRAVARPSCSEEVSPASCGGQGVGLRSGVSMARAPIHVTGAHSAARTQCRFTGGSGALHTQDEQPDVLTGIGLAAAAYSAPACDVPRSPSCACADAPPARGYWPAIRLPARSRSRLKGAKIRMMDQTLAESTRLSIALTKQSSAFRTADLFAEACLTPVRLSLWSA